MRASCRVGYRPIADALRYQAAWGALTCVQASAAMARITSILDRTRLRGREEDNRERATMLRSNAGIDAPLRQRRSPATSDAE